MANGEVHVYPVNDSRQHVASVLCWCVPMCDAEEPSLIVHTAADGRAVDPEVKVRLMPMTAIH